MKTPEQVKGNIRNIANQYKLHPQEVLQMYLFDRILMKLSLSKYKSNFILKGGLLISSIIGIAERTTMDMDVTVKNIPVDEQGIVEIIKEIISIDTSDGIIFEYKRIESIRDSDEYNNFRIYLSAVYGRINASMKIDITTGDSITPEAISYSYGSLFNEETIKLMAYPIETILAEKYETVIRRNIGNTRSRDFYDLFVLFKTKSKDVDKINLQMAIKNTGTKRGSLDYLRDWDSIIKDISNDPSIKKMWVNYVNNNEYARNISFEDIMKNLKDIAEFINYK